jgi:excisionase family DNA binding protein
MQDALAVNIPEAARRLGLSPRTVATLVSRGHLMSRKVGRRRIIPVLALEAFLRNDHGPKPVESGIANKR